MNCTSSDHTSPVPAVGVFADHGARCEACANLVNAWFAEGARLMFVNTSLFSQRMAPSTSSERNALRTALAAAEATKPFEVRAIRTFCNATVAEGDEIWSAQVRAALRVLR